ncbi:MAG: MazG family protein [Dactylosporangium sp.]|nr:MazG family protein [Dactylosporangium sp.]NNJ63708.1 MazG family protein [Dactylosporangium sp.]
MGRRIVLLVTSPRLPAGLLTAEAWDLVRTHRVCAAVGNPQAEALRAVGIGVAPAAPVAESLLREASAHATVVWLSGPDGDEALARDLGLRLARNPGLAELELMYGSWDPPGARLLDVVAVMERLVAPGGDPWLSRQASAENEQAHQNFARYLLEEAYEAYDAICAGNMDALREELGDVLLQVVLHAKLGAAPGDEGGFAIDDVAGDLIDKLVRRNPHVFGGVEVKDLDEITANWERIKRSEKARTSLMDGIALSQPALSLAAEVLSKAESADPELARPAAPVAAEQRAAMEAELGDRLFSLVGQARATGLDAEAVLRRVVLDLMDELRHEESAPPRQ